MKQTRQRWRAMAGAAALVLLACGPATAQSPLPLDRPAPDRPAPNLPPPRPEAPAAEPPAADAPAARRPAEAQTPAAAARQLDRLYTRLKEAKTAREAEGVANLIARRWARSGSDTADLLMSRVQQAMKSENLPLALEIVDRIIAIEPDWAEGWNQRANLFFRLDDHVRALLDIAETLKREPRHFGALAGLGAIMQAQGQEKAALRAFREAVKIHPHLEAAKQAVERLAPDVDGRDA